MGSEANLPACGPTASPLSTEEFEGWDLALESLIS